MTAGRTDDSDAKAAQACRKRAGDVVRIAITEYGAELLERTQARRARDNAEEEPGVPRIRDTSELARGGAMMFAVAAVFLCAVISLWFLAMGWRFLAAVAAAGASGAAITFLVAGKPPRGEFRHIVLGEAGVRGATFGNELVAIGWDEISEVILGREGAPDDYALIKAPGKPAIRIEAAHFLRFPAIRRVLGGVCEGLSIRCHREQGS